MLCCPNQNIMWLYKLCRNVVFLQFHMIQIFRWYHKSLQLPYIRCSCLCCCFQLFHLYSWSKQSRCVPWTLMQNFQLFQRCQCWNNWLRRDFQRFFQRLSYRKMCRSQSTRTCLLRRNLKENKWREWSRN